MHMKQFMCVKQCVLCSDTEQVGAVMPLEIQLETAPNSSCYQQSQAVKRRALLVYIYADRKFACT